MTALLRRFTPALILFLLGAALAALIVPAELEQMRWEVPGMPSTYPLEQQLRPILLLTLCMLPCAGAVVYALLGTMDRYIMRAFTSYFLMCTLILLLIYILADFTDNMERFRTRFDNPIVQAGLFYAMQLPMFLYQILPYTLLMGALWSLSKLSGTCELTGMLQSGRSLLRVCRPIFYVAALVALVYGICGFHWAPNGSLYRQLLLKQAPPSGQQKALVFRSEKDARIWRIAKPASITNPGEPMRGVIIEQFDADNRGELLRQYFAESATWNKADSTWTLRNAYERDLSHAHEVPVDDRFLGTCTLPFDEKPYQIITPGQGGRVDSIGTATLYECIAGGSGSREDRAKMRTEWHVRIARIFSCLILVLMAIPSAVTFQRRGTMKGIGIAVLLAALLLFFYRLFPALGEARLIPAWISAWIPNAAYLLISVYLFRVNLAHRSLREWLTARLHGEP